MENFIFIKNLDIIGNDIYRFNKPIEELFKIAISNKNCIGFNTLGFFKNKIDNLEKSNYFNNNDGIYIKKEIYEKYLINNNLINNELINDNLINNLNKKIRVKMICNWCSSYQLCVEFGNMCKDNYSWNNIEITWDNNNIDYFVIINKPSNNNEYFIPEKTIVFQTIKGGNKGNIWALTNVGLFCFNQNLDIIQHLYKHETTGTFDFISLDKLFLSHAYTYSYVVPINKTDTII